MKTIHHLGFKIAGIACLGSLLLVPLSILLATEGTVEVTAQGFRGETGSSKFTEYRSVPEGVYVEKLSVKTPIKSAAYLKLEGTKLGLDDQNISLKFGEIGTGEIGFKFDQTPHNFSNTGKSFFVHDGNGNLTISNQIQTSLMTNANNATAVFSDVPSVDLKLRRDSFSSYIQLEPSDNLRIRFSGAQENRNGSRPIGVAFGHSSIIEVPEPISYTTQDISASAQLNQKTYNLIFNWNSSVFRNSIDALTVDNVYRSTSAAISTSGGSAPDRGRLALPPDNHSHNFSLAGGANLPFWNSRLNAAVSYGWMKQNEQFLPLTINQKIIDRANVLGISLAPPQPSLNGNIRTLSANSSLSLRPVNRVNLVGKVNYYKLDNQTPELLFTQYIPYDASLSTSTPGGNFKPSLTRRSASVGYSKLNAGTNVSYQFLSSLGMTFGYEWEKIERSHRETKHTNEHILTASMNYLPKNWISLRPNYIHSNRYTDHYSAEEVAEEGFPVGEGTSLGQLPELRKVDQANRLRDQVGIKSIIYPLDSVTVGAEYSYRVDDYNGSLYGALNELNHSYGIDLTYEPFEALTLFGDYAQENAITDMRSRYRATGNDKLANDWIFRSEDLTDTIGAGANGVLVQDKLDMDVSYNFSRSVGKLYASNPAPVATVDAQVSNFPETKTELHKAATSLKWRVVEDLTVRLKYEYERYMVTDFAFDDIQVWQSVWNQSVFLDASQGNYTAHVVGLGLIYKF